MLRHLLRDLSEYGLGRAERGFESRVWKFGEPARLDEAKTLVSKLQASMMRGWQVAVPLTSDTTGAVELPHIKPKTPVAALSRDAYRGRAETFPIDDVVPLVGMTRGFIMRVVGNKRRLNVPDVLALLDQDAYGETFVPRSRVLDYLLENEERKRSVARDLPDSWSLIHGDFMDIGLELPAASIQCVMTSTPYWGTRIYKDSRLVHWADGEVCAFGHEQTPEGFVRHTIEVLYQLKPLLTESGSVWWNLMDTFLTRTQIRGNAYEALKAMDGRSQETWSDYAHRRYSHSHSYLKDGEQCDIPGLVAARASRIGYYVKSVITWAKINSLPEPQISRVSRSIEYVLHLSTTRAPKLDKETYKRLSIGLGGRNERYEGDKLSDHWVIPVSSGGDGHGAQFPTALPGRCIAISTDPGEIVLDPFVGSGTTGVAALSLGRRFIGIDVSAEYLALADKKICEVEGQLPLDITPVSSKSAEISFTEPTEAEAGLQHGTCRSPDLLVLPIASNVNLLLTIDFRT
jgi:DNA modification methylase